VTAADEEAAVIEGAMQAAGVAIDEPGFEDYFGFEEKHKWYFPDHKQWIEFQVMNEGARARYQKATSRDVRLFKTTGDASIKLDPSEERKILLDQSVVGWNLMRRNLRTQEWEQSPFSIGTSGSEFAKWLDKANPKLISDLELAIRKANPWMQAEMTVEMIDDEIKNLEELRVEAVKREEGKFDS
jgi:hypothetical protein